MIIKFYELNKINLDKNKLILFYGKNEGLKNEAINNLAKNRYKITRYEEREILENKYNFIESLLSKSLFENEKLIIIKRSSDKIIEIVNEISLKDIGDTKIIFNADNLEKKSKLRSLFEKNKDYISVAFYPDTNQTISKLAYNFFKEKKILISQSNINLVINKCNGDREILLNELKKIEYFAKNGKKITSENISKLTNLIENHSVSELVDNCLIKNKSKIINILSVALLIMMIFSLSNKDFDIMLLKNTSTLSNISFSSIFVIFSLVTVSKSLLICSSLAPSLIP